MRKQHTDRFWMEKAYAMALKAQEAQEVPIAAVLVSKDEELLAISGNEVLQRSDPTAHAELLVIRAAARKLGNYRLENTVLYTTLEPCVMCAGAMVHARIARLVFACRDFQRGAAGSVCNVLKGQPWNHPVQIDEGILEAPCKALLDGFFAERRGI